MTEADKCNRFSEFSSQNTLQQSIGAAYGIFSVGWTNVKLQGGIRVEDPRANCGDDFRQQYNKMFRTLLYQHK